MTQDLLGGSTHDSTISSGGIRGRCDVLRVVALAAVARELTVHAYRYVDAGDVTPGLRVFLRTGCNFDFEKLGCGITSQTLLIFEFAEEVDQPTIRAVVEHQNPGIGIPPLVGGAASTGFILGFI